MTASAAERAIAALHDQLAAGIAAEAARTGETFPEIARNDGRELRTPPEGRLVLWDGEPGEPIEMTFGPTTWTYAHEAQLDVLVPGDTADDRDAKFDLIRKAVGAAIALDDTLGGACVHCRPTAAELSDLKFEDANPIKAASIGIVVEYDTTDPLGG